MNKITSEDVCKVAKLARLDLEVEEVSKYAKQLEKIISYVAQLENIDTKEITPTTRAVEVTNVFRKDNIEINRSRDEILDLAPKREGEFFKVPKILSD
tara:strand:- start:25 stop:318 length:294 start_codon:yes stop_codon:yes gene_type:complete